MKFVSQFPAAIAVASLFWGHGGHAAASSPAAAGQPDRQQIQSMLIQSGYSSVASLRLVHSRWIGTGAHDGEVVEFVVDAATGRLVSEVQAR